MTLSALGDAAILISLGDRIDAATARRVQAIVAEIERRRFAGVTEVVGAFASVAVFYDPAQIQGFEALKTALAQLAAGIDAAAGSGSGRRIELPVCYGGEHGPDLASVARHTRLSPAEVIAAHAGAEYQVHAIGFAPGFPYLGGLPAALATPRRATPRATVPAGSVAIGGAQSGVYPFATPGGWNLIGRTPVALFDPERSEPALLATGDRVVFRAIDAEEFARIAAGSGGALRVPTESPAAGGALCPDERASAVASEHKAPPSVSVVGSGREAEKSDTHDGVEILRPGMLTTVQDLGRVGHRARGVPRSGAADTVAARVANLLVGNAESAAVLEFTLVGPEVRFRSDAVVALAGADFGLPRWRPFRVQAGETLKFGGASAGCRGYLAIAGGFDVRPVLGSRSTYLRAGLGGFKGRSLREGDVLPVSAARCEFEEHWLLDERVLPAFSGDRVVRFVDGVHAERFPGDWAARSFRTTTQSDRIGVRLEGEPVRATTAEELVSLPVTPGTIQVPPDGQPIVLLADAQTIGGYPQIGHVIAADLSLVAQLRPGDTLRFDRVSLDEAHAAWLARERALGMLREGLAQKIHV